MRGPYRPSARALRQVSRLAERFAGQISPRALAEKGSDAPFAAIAQRDALMRLPVFDPIESALRCLADSEARLLNLSRDRVEDWDCIEEIVLRRLTQLFWQIWEDCVKPLRRVESRQAANTTPAAASPPRSAPTHTRKWKAGVRDAWEAMILLDIPDRSFPAGANGCFALPTD